MSPALAGRFLTTAPPGKPKAIVLNHYVNNAITTDSNDTVTPAMIVATAAATITAINILLPLKLLLLSPLL